MANRSVKVPTVQPRVIIHGGAGNINRENLPPKLWNAYATSLLSILQSTNSLLKDPSTTALDAATHAVTMLENNALFNAGKGAVFTTAGTNELEASVMVSRGHRKRGVGVMGLKRVKNPIKLAREMLLRGDEKDGGGAQGHCQINGEEMEELAKRWGCEMVDPQYFWTKKRWQEHKRHGSQAIADQAPPGSPASTDDEGGRQEEDSDWNGKDYLPQGTVGCVVLDSSGTICVATSTGGMTNKLPGRIGDTPTLGAGFWAEEWNAWPYTTNTEMRLPDVFGNFASLIPFAAVRNCLISTMPQGNRGAAPKSGGIQHAVGMSGTGNGDSFLRLSAVRTAAAMSRFSGIGLPLQAAITKVAGTGGELQKSAGDRWGKTFEGQGGIIGIELINYGGKIVFDFNCGGMFRAWNDDSGEAQCMVFKEKY